MIRQSTMKRIRIFSPYGCLCDEFTKRYGNSDEHIFVNDDSYTHAIIVDCIFPENLLTDRDHTIGIATEPLEFLGLTHEFIRYAQKYIGKYFIGEYAEKLGAPFVNKRFFCVYYMPFPQIIAPKKNIMSMALSRKQLAPGHKYRHVLLKEILKTDLPIDIYGRGCALYPPDPRLKGEFKSHLKVHETYRYHIAIENFQRKWLYTEKIINPLQAGTVPLYWGCSNIDEIFPNTPIIYLSGNVKEDMETIRSICENPVQIPIDRNAIHERLSFKEMSDEL